MALKEIEYGSLASSADLNNNFLYLDNKIAETSGTINTSISSILSNIATINSRLSDLAENLVESVGEVSATLSVFKTKALSAFNKVSMIPDWANCAEITDTSEISEYEVSSNGYLLFITVPNATGDLIVNEQTVKFKNRVNNYDNSSLLVAIPVCEGDKVTCTFAFTKVYFLPAFGISYEDD